MNKIINANCLDGLKELPDNSVDSIVTDPPYGLSFMGKAWDYDVPKVEIWRECLRVLKPGGHLLSFFGTRTYHRGVVAIEDAGFEIRDQIGWAYGSGFPKSHNISKAITATERFGGSSPKNTRQARLGDDYKPTGQVDYKRGRAFSSELENEVKSTELTEAAKQWQGWGTALKPAWEPICVARKPFKGTVAENVLEHGTGAINIDGCRVGVYGARNNGRGRSKANAFGEHGATEKVDYGVGRWPANLIHDGSEEVVGLFPKTVSTLDRTPINRGASASWFTGDHVDRIQRGDSGSAARFFYCAKASKKDREEGCEALPEKQYSHDGREKPIDNAYQRNSNSNSNHHPTVKPTDLMRYLVRLVTPPGGTVLDPFMGSGSTGKAAVLEGFGFIGMEREAEYCQIADKRIAAVQPKQEDLFDE